MTTENTNNIQFFDIVENSNGVDNTFEVRCIGSAAVVAVFSYWDAEQEAFQHATKFAELLTQFYKSNWGEIDLDGIKQSVQHHQRAFGELYE